MEFLLDITIIFAVSAIVLYFSGRLKLPGIVALLISGLIAGPYGLQLVSSVQIVNQLADIGILLLLFAIGIEFSLDKLLKTRKLILLGGGLQVLVTILIVFGIYISIGTQWNQALFIGFLFSLSSTAIVISLLQEKAEIDTSHGKTALAILIFQDVIVIPMMLMVPFLSGESLGLSAFFDLIKGIGLVIVVLFLARVAMPRLINLVVKTRNKELFLLFILVVCFATAFFTQLVGLKLALGAFLAGLIISESDYSLAALSEILPFKKIFTSLFFVSIGMLLDVGFLIENVLVVISATVGIIILKMTVILLIGFMLKISIRPLIITAISLSMVGEFAFVLSEAGMDSDILSRFQYQLFLAVSIFSMGVSPFLIKFAPKIASRLAVLPAFNKWDQEGNLASKNEEPIKNLDTIKIVIIGYGINGRNLSSICKKVDIPYSIIELNPVTVKQELEKGEPILYGDAINREILIKAGIFEARVVVIAISDRAATEMVTHAIRHINHDIHIIVRTRFVSEVESLQKHGANEVIPEEFETSLHIIDLALSVLNKPKEEIDTYLKDIREKTYQMLRDNINNEKI